MSRIREAWEAGRNKSVLRNTRRYQFWLMEQIAEGTTDPDALLEAARKAARDGDDD